MAKHPFNRYSLILLFLFIPSVLMAAPPTSTYTYEAGETINPDEVQQNEANIYNYLTTGVDTYKSGSILNADISGSAAITYGKLSLGSSLLTSDIKDGEIVNADVSSSAAIAASKLNLTDITTFTAGGDLDIGTYEFRANTLESDVATGTAPFTIASTTKVSNLNVDTLDGYDTSTSAGVNKIYVSGADNYLPDTTVDTTALKTTTGEVSNAVNEKVQATLPGGTYGFYPQIKATEGNGSVSVNIHASTTDTQTLSSTYATSIMLFPSSSGSTVYAQQRYVTASGQDHWVFLLIDKVTKDIIGGYSAPDHPAYGNGGNFDKLPHPFGSYDETRHEIVLVDNDTIAELKAQVTEEKSLLTLVNELYKPKMDKEEIYKPLHSGRFIDKKPELVQNIPDYIKVRELQKMNAEELQEKENKRQLAIQKAEQEKQKKQQDRINAENKLKTLGLTEDEVETLK